MRKRNISFFYFLSLVGVLLFQAISFQGVAQSYLVKKLKLSSEWDQVFIKDLTVDSLGFIWYLTHNEIYRFDGYRSLNVSNTIKEQLSGNHFPQKILADQKKRIWIVSNESIQFLDLKTWNVIQVDRKLPRFPSGVISGVFLVNQDHVVFLYESGEILVYHQEKFTVIDDLIQKSLPSRTKIIPLSLAFWNEKMWVGTSTGDLLSIDLTPTFKTEFHVLPGVETSVNNIIAHTEGLYLNVFPDLLYDFNQNGSIKEVKRGGFKPNGLDFYVIQGGDNFNVFADANRVSILDNQLEVLYETKMSLENDFGPKHLVIKENEVILGTEEGIVVVYPKTEGLTAFIPENESLNKSVRSLYVFPDASYFYNSYQGAGYVNPQGKHQFIPSLKYGYVTYPINAHQLLLGTEGGYLKIFDKRTVTVKDIPLQLADESSTSRGDLPLHILSLAENNNDYIIGSFTGVWLLDKKTFLLRKAPDKANQSFTLDLHVRDILILKDQSWLLSTQMGLFKYSEGIWTKIYPKRTNLGVYKTIFYQDHYYVATQGNGILILDSLFHFEKKWDRGTGLSHNVVFSLERVDDIFIAGTADGLSFINKDSIRILNLNDGLMHSEFNSGASFYDSQRNIVYMGGLKGYSKLNMQINWFSEMPAVQSHVTELYTYSSRDGKRTAYYNWPYTGENQLKLKPHESLIGLFVGVPAYYKSQVELQYFINKGLGEYLKNDQFISLIDSEPGKYDLNIQTLNRGKVISNQIFSIQKLPHFYQSWWFRISIFLLLLGIFYVWYLNRVKKLKDEQKLRNQIAADLHDEVGSYLTRIFYQSHAGTEGKGDSDDSKIQFDKIASTSKIALSTMSDLVWSIEPKFDTLNDLLIRMKDYAFKMKEEFDFSYTFQDSGFAANKKISQNIRQNVFQIYKESVNNALKYGEGARITFSVTPGDWVNFEIINELRENPAFSSIQGGNGLKYMESRVKKINGKIQIQKEEKYFRLAISFPLQ